MIKFLFLLWDPYETNKGTVWAEFVILERGRSHWDLEGQSQGSEILTFILNWTNQT